MPRQYPYVVTININLRDDGDECGEWLIENASELWYRNLDGMFNPTNDFYFVSEADATLFALKWR